MRPSASLKAAPDVICRPAERRIAIEELCDYTKISKNYLVAMENEDFAKLPAAVFLRGFVTQVAKYLKLPHEKVVTAFMARYNQFHNQRQAAGR